MNEPATFQDLINLMSRLRAPDGCPWDREQTYASLAPMLIEEAYEVIEAAEVGNWAELRDELGDLLFQIVFYGQIGTENEHFDLYQSITRVQEKMIRRHPHVFGDQQVADTAEVLVNWEAIKAAERRAAGKPDNGVTSLLDGVSKKIPALLEAHQLTAKAARVGFDWPRLEDVFAKLNEEIQELQTEIDRAECDQEAIVEEVGDLLFVAANIARRLGVEPEMALKGANRKFRRRFRHVEDRLTAQGRSCAEASLQEMDAYWNEIRAQDKTKSA